MQPLQSLLPATVVSLAEVYRETEGMSMEERARLGGYFLHRKCGQERSSGLCEGHWTFPSRRRSRFQEVKVSASLQAIPLGSSTDLADLAADCGGE